MTTTVDPETGRIANAAKRVREDVADTVGTAREKAGDAYLAARERAHSAYDSTREGVDARPGIALVGGIALGALIAAILPGTRREDQAFGKVGRRIRETAKQAANAAREEGVRKLDELGLNKETARQKLGDIAGGAKEAARASATAARDTAKAAQTNH